MIFWSESKTGLDMDLLYKDLDPNPIIANMSKPIVGPNLELVSVFSNF